MRLPAARGFHNDQIVWGMRETEEKVCGKDGCVLDKRCYWAWLQQAFGAGSAKPWTIYNRFHKDLEGFYKSGARLWNSLEFISERESRLLYSFTPVEAEAIIEVSEKLGHKVITPECEKYPEALKNIFDPPAVLYYRGKLPDFDQTPTVAVIGTRKPEVKTAEAATSMGYQLAISGATVVSGGALGVDSAAHRGAIKGMGKTVAVLPCGLSNGYLVENHMLREQIAQNGALVTEYSLNIGVAKGTFRVRNRLMSGLSCGIVIYGAGEKSGTLLTANSARDQNRDVFVFAGDAENPKAKGSHSLLMDGAKPVFSAEDVLEEYKLRYKLNTKKKRSIVRQPQMQRAAVLAEPELGENEEVSDAARRILFVLNGEMHITEIAESAGLEMSATLAAMTELELMGYVQAYSGRRYKRIQ